MRKRVFGLIVLGLLCIFGSARSEDTTMVRMLYRYDSPGLQEDAFARKTKALWRSGSACARTEEMPDSANGIHGLMIIHEPDFWMINRFTNSGVHGVDPGPTFNASCPAFPFPGLGIFGKIELGHELAFFEEHGATKQSADSTYGVPCDVYSMTSETVTGLLYLRKDSGFPLLIKLESEGFWLSVVYDAYEVGLPYDSTMFLPPAGVVFEEAE